MYLQKYLAKDFPRSIRERGALIYETGGVFLASGNQKRVSAEVQGTRVYGVVLSRGQDGIHAHCECPYYESEAVCKHIWAAIMAAERHSYLLGSWGGKPPRLIQDEFLTIEDHPFGDLGATDTFYPATPSRVSNGEGRTLARQPPPRPWQDLLRPLTAHPLVSVKKEEWRSDRELYYIVDATSAYKQDLCVRIEHRERTKSGTWGKLKPFRTPLSLIRAIPDVMDREVLTALAGTAQPYYSYAEESVPSECYLKHSTPEILMPRICATGRCRLRIESSLLPLEALPVLQWDEGEAWRFRLIVERQGNIWAARGILHRGEERMDVTLPVVLLEAGVLVARDRVARLNHGDCFAWINLLRTGARIQVPLSQGPQLVAEILKSPNPPDTEWPEDLRFEEIAATPRPLLKFTQGKTGWDRDKMRGQLFFEYAGQVVAFDTESQGLFQADEKRYFRRDASAERAAVQTLTDLRLKQEERIYGVYAPRWEVAAKKLPAVVRKLVQAGWHIEADGKAFRRAASFSTELSSGVDWFELHGGADYGGIQVTLPELLKAVQRGEGLIQLGDGSYGILPEEFLEKYGLLTRIGRAQKDHIRFSSTQSGLLDVLLAARPEIQVDAAFAKAREELRKFDGIQPADQPAGFAGELRGYQREGLGWMYFLQRLGFGGCLADDMGVGKTPQVLALLESRRELRKSKTSESRPSLVVVPRSLIYNWKQEAERFTPKLRVLDHSGAGQEKSTQLFDNHDLILSTYGTLRRDAALLQDYLFDYVILDEAQAIKNSASESAKAVRLLQANHRLTMSGTPIENHLGELWSLFEFLNPGMLGGAALFQGAGSTLRNPDEETRMLLAKAVRPFILRRTKAQVVKELPAKSEQTIYCELDVTQRKLYNELREHYRQSLLGRIKDFGMAKSKMHILEALLRLRQAACHPGLIDKNRVDESSAKLEALIPQLTEVMEEGHKALVFSQFTSLLSIVRGHLDRAGVTYEYLDGKTSNRQKCVEHFQGDPDCKLFLISLKAGGVGLNLTAAEYVFLLDPWWNPAVEAQAIDRTHRIGQKRPVFAYRLIAKDTVEEKVLELQKSKRALADAIISEDNRMVGNLKREDLELLLS